MPISNVLLLPGWGLPASLWRGVQDCLPKTWCVQAPDLPGVGSAVDDGRSLEDFLDDWAARLPENTVLAGWSLGGVLAAKLAHRAQGTVAGIVTIATSPCFVVRPDWPDAVSPPLMSQFRSDLERDVNQLLRHFVALVCQGSAQAMQELRSLRSQLAAAPAPDFVKLQQLLTVLEADSRVFFQSLPCSWLALQGEKDALVPASIADCLRRHGAEVEILEKCAHAPFLAQPSLVAERLIRFCDGLRP